MQHTLMQSARHSIAVLLAGALCVACSNDPAGPGGDRFTGYLYTTTNANSGNGVIALGRQSDGSLAELTGSPYLTGAAGDAADGDFDTEGGVRIIGDYLLAVNAGANPVNGSVSVFKINRKDGSLARVDQNSATPAVDNMDSRGERSVSIASSTIGGTTWVVVGNQFANPNYQKSPAEAFGAVMSTPARNLTVFTFDQLTGQLTFNKVGVTYMDGNNGGPTTAVFNSDGSKLIVSTWGVPHFDAPDANLALQKPGRLYVYTFANGTLSQTGMYEEVGVSGNIGISWSPNNQFIYMTNFNLHSSKENQSVTVHDGTTGAKVQNFATGSRNDEACWTLVSRDRTKLFTASFTSNDISTFDIGTDGRLAVSLNPNSVVRRAAPPQDTKEMYQSADGYLYVAGAFKSHSVAIFRVAANGALTELANSPFPVPSSTGKTNMEQAYIGLTGFDK